MGEHEIFGRSIWSEGRGAIPYCSSVTVRAVADERGGCVYEGERSSVEVNARSDEITCERERARTSITLFRLSSSFL